MDRRANKPQPVVEGDLLSSAVGPPVLEVEMDGLPEASGTAGPTGSVTSLSWRAPKK